MPSSGHVHDMHVISWSTRTDQAYFEDGKPFPPAILTGCTNGICARTESYRPTRRHRALPEGITREQFDQLRNGAYWNEIVGA